MDNQKTSWTHHRNNISAEACLGDFINICAEVCLGDFINISAEACLGDFIVARRCARYVMLSQLPFSVNIFFSATRSLQP